MKVCSLYGAGFYYIPGTDICMKVGGYIRYQVNYGTGNSMSAGPFSGTGGFNNRVVNDDVSQRTRAVATFDTRQQTAYGTLRTYLLMGFNQDTAGATGVATTAPPVYITRGFIQIAGFTFGKATSFFDFVSTAAVAYNAGFTHAPDTGDAGQMVGSYTAQFGNGVSGTIGIEQSRRIGTVYTGAAGVSAAYALGAAPTLTNTLGGNATAGVAGLPDIVGNIRVDQAWGSAQIAAAAHNVDAAYYGAGALAGVFEQNGHPGSKWGFAVSPGLRLNAPMIGPGDYFQTAFVYTQGAVKYASNTPLGTGIGQYWSGNSVGFGNTEDGIFSGTATAAGPFGNSIQLTTAWSVFASYEHFWTPSLRTSVYGSYVAVSRNASGNAMACGSLLAAEGLPAATPCDMNFQMWNIGSRSQWNVTKDFYVGLDVIYGKIQSASLGNGAAAFIPSPGATTGIGAGTFHTADQDAVTATWRVHRDIVP